MNYLVTIGLEIHASVKSARKVFSNAINDYDAPTNHCVAYLDLGLPGTLPILNLDVVKKAIQFAHFLKMDVAYYDVCFDRKNYFYYDLPKGYQLTQYYQPIGRGGSIYLPKCQKQIDLVQVQIEEDTAKQTQEHGQLTLDYNRCGCPLLEIVSQPQFSTAEEVLEFLVYLKRSLVFNEIFDGKMEFGNLRVDLNISLRNKAQTQLNNKVEIKNVGSFNAVAAAINYEIQRQSELLANNQVVPQETRRWDETKQATVFMRKKNDAVAYSFMPDANLGSYSFSEAQYQEIISAMPKSWLDIAADLSASGLSESQVNHVLDDYDLWKQIATLYQQLPNYQKCYKWLGMEILGYLNKNQQKFSDLSAAQWNQLHAAIIALEVDQAINGKQIKIVFTEIINENLTLAAIIAKHQMVQITDVDQLSTLVDGVFEKLGDQLNQLQTNLGKLEKLVIGQVMAQTKGQANPKVLKSAYDLILKKRLN